MLLRHPSFEQACLWKDGLNITPQLLEILQYKRETNNETLVVQNLPNRSDFWGAAVEVANRQYVLHSVNS